MSKILATSPYPQFTQLVKQVSKELNLNVRIIEAVSEEAAQLVQEEINKNDYEVIISRGATAEAIKNIVDVPVVTADFCDFDLLQALWQAKSLGSPIAYLGNAYREDNDFAEVVGILGVEVKQYLYRNFKDVERDVIQACEDGFEVIVGGGFYGQQLAIANGMKGVLILSSHRTITQAMERAVEMINIRRRDREYSRLLSTMMQSVSDGIICLDTNWKLLFINQNAEELLGFKGTQESGKIATKVNTAVLPLLNLPQGIGQRCNVKGMELVVNRVVVAEGKEQFGELFTMQKVSHLQQLEQKIRTELHLKGLVARFTLNDIVTEDKYLSDIIAKARSFAQVDSTVLIRGESGTGKELFAQGIHRASQRANNPFVAVNCASLPNELLESELFGYEEGAFTGARKGGKPGLFELAHRGTIFLDEIGSIPLNLQDRLLRVLQEREVMRVGGDSILPVNVRCIAATNRNLQQAIKEGSFRQDLYFRLNVLNLTIPPLRSRPGDISLLARHFLNYFNQRFHKHFTRLSASAMRWLNDYCWPGNVRELQNFIERLVILADNKSLDEKWVKQLIAEADEGLLIGDSPKNDSVTVKLGTLEEMEWQLIAAVENRGGGNQTEMAKSLGISRTTLWKKLIKKTDD